MSVTAYAGKRKKETYFVSLVYLKEKNKSDINKEVNSKNILQLFS